MAMLRLLLYFLTKKNYVIIMGRGGLGDYLLCTPLFRSINKYDSSMRICFICSKHNLLPREVLLHNPYIEFISAPNFLMVFVAKIPNIFHTRYGHYCPGITAAKPAQEFILDIFNSYLKVARLCFDNGKAKEIPLFGNKLEIYLTPEEEECARSTFSQYDVVITVNITSRCSKNQMWTVDKWTDLVNSFPDYTFIQLCLLSEDSIEGTIDMRNLSFRRQIALIKFASVHVGVDTFFSHVTNAFQTPGVVLFGDSNPEVWGHSNNINIYKNLRCSPCGHLLFGQGCPYGIACMNGITVQEVKNAIIKQLNKNDA